MIHASAKLLVGLLFVVATVLFTGCVERSLKISSDPQGARVFVNDKEIGVTPVKTNFLWYGEYDLILRREGFKTLKTSYLAKAPWYQYPPIDLIAECLIATTIKDEHVLPTYQLEPAAPPVLEEAVKRAVDLRSEAVGQAPPTE